MRRRKAVIAAGVTSLATLVLVGHRWVSAQQPPRSQGAPDSALRVAAVPGEKGGQDTFGAYDVVADWPKNLSTIPGHEGWTFGAGQSVFAESPNRVFVLQRGELPNIKAPATKKLTDTAPSIFFPIGRLPWRDATVSSPPGNGGTGQPAEGGVEAWERTGIVARPFFATPYPGSEWFYVYKDKILKQYGGDLHNLAHVLSGRTHSLPQLGVQVLGVDGARAAAAGSS